MESLRRKGMSGGFMKKYQRWKFDKKMFVFLSAAMWVSVILLMIVSVISTVRAITRQSRQLVEQRVETQASNTAENFKQYEDILWSIMIDSSVQSYLQDKERYGYLSQAQETLENVCNMVDNLQFVQIISADGSKSCIKGDSILNSSEQLSEIILSEYKDSLKMSSRETSMRAMTYNTTYTRTNDYTLMIYQPVYSGTELDQYMGMLCLNIDDLNLTQTMESSNKNLNMDNYFLYSDGTIISCADPDRIGTKLDISKMDKKSGSFWSGGSLWVYHRLSGWNYFYATNISLYELSKGNIRTLIVVLILLLCLLTFMQKAAGKLIREAYRPWQKVAETMGQVSEGDLSARIYAKDTDPDMEMISQGFNHMMETVNQLMEQVKEEQQLLDQIKFDALQSQIQPHFLYNTLDCIHWQAVMDGNREISQLVKALAAYYRICLSKGREIITVREETTHILNYLYIQQMRYGDILTYEIKDMEALEKVQIPKLTLQPLVENSIYHGIKVKDGMKGHVVIRGVMEDEYVEILVEDSGTGMTEEQIAQMNENIHKCEEGTGYGVRNVNRRIQLLFGCDYGLHYEKNNVGGVTVKIKIPREYLRVEEDMKSAEIYFQ